MRVKGSMERKAFLESQDKGAKTGANMKANT
jgi:hypothetical protein